MNSPGRLFRLRFLGKQLARAKLFRATREEFRSALADALIDLRLEDPDAPIAVEIAYETKSRAAWIGMGREGEPVELRQPIRWESASSLFDSLQKAQVAGAAAGAKEKGGARQSPTTTQ